MKKIENITLPSFLRRVFKAYAIKAVIRAQGGELSRIGRSRNWLLKATPDQITAIINLVEESNEDSWLWLAKHLKTHRQVVTHQQLLSIASKRSNMSINELMSLTDCTIAQARKVLDELEWQKE
ncbi:MAG: ribosome recycling factor family protein [Thalassotalea sp.]